MKKRLTLALIALSALTLSACGLRGDLDRPPPAWFNLADETAVAL